MFQSDFTTDELKARRERLAEAIGEGAVALLQGADDPPSMGVFRQSNEIYYLSGIEVPHAYLVIRGGSGHSTLFLPRESLLNKDCELRPLSSDDPSRAVEATGVDDVRGIEDLHGALKGAGVIYTLLREGQGEMCTSGSLSGRNRGVMADLWDCRPDLAMHLVDLIRDRCPLAEYVAGGARGRGYSAIVAGGVNTFYGHYMRNFSELKDGDFVLLDCAPDYRYYTSDITRMWPANGTYSKTQRALYGFVIEYHKTLLAQTRAGRTLEDIRVESAEIMKGRIGEFKFASSAHEAGARRMFDSHAHLSHTVGMAVHDGGGHKGPPLVPGIVFSVDPQFVLPEEKLYVRCEDTGVVTEDGFEVFTKDAPLELDDIEAMMKEDGVLQRFPPIRGRP